MLRVMQKSTNPPLAPISLEDSGRIVPTKLVMDAANNTSFPATLYEMLCEIGNNDDGDGLAKIVTWQPHGKCFLIKDKEEFIAKVLPKWFCRLKFTTFERQLHKHGFRKLTRKGPDQGAYYHPEFQRALPEVAKAIRHTTIKGKRGRKPKSKLTEPDFYSADSKLPASSSAGGGTAVSGFEGLRSRPRNSIVGASTALRHDSEAYETTTRPAMEQHQSAAFDIQARGNHSLLGNVNYRAEQREMPSRQSSLMLPAMQHQDSLSYNQHHVSATNEAVGPFPPSQLGRAASDISLLPLTGGDLGVFGTSPLSESSPPDNTTGQVSDSTHNQFQPMTMPIQLPYQEHSQRIDDLIARNQQQQMNLQMQFQQLEQQRFELQSRQQQNNFQQQQQHQQPYPRQQQQQWQQEFSGWQAMGQPVNGSSFGSNQLFPMSSSSNYPQQQQQFQQYPTELNQQPISAPGMVTSRQQQLQGQYLPNQGQGQGDYQNCPQQHFQYSNPNL